ncbi:MAG TPA: hypothetical protein VF433_02220 [Cellvibrio sp.]
MKLVALIVTFLASLLAVFWLFYAPGFDSGLATLASLAAFTSAFFLNKPSPISSQVQHASEGSVAVQAGRDVNTGNITKQ